jgi:uncharacterized tellurite resistance protein B-like protein
VTVAGYRIPGGMFYVGQGLRSVNGHGIEPALIDPTLPVNTRSLDPRGDQMQYWPSYSAIRPASRATYLAWLASGRCDPAIGIGYVFLFFYGLERRVFLEAHRDPALQDELPRIADEVERLLGIYQSGGSFGGYARSFLDVLRVLRPGSPHYVLTPPLSATPGYEVPLGVRLALGQLVLEGKPIPADWALAWYRSAPETRLRTPAQRCVDEFATLFRTRYHERFGAGIVVKPNRQALKASYRPASASFGGPIELSFTNRAPAMNVPDVTTVQGPLTKMTEVAETCLTDLEPFSRWVGRNPSLRSSPAAVALLPTDLVASHRSEALDKLWEVIELRLEGNPAVELPGSELLDRWGNSPSTKVVRADATLLARLLEKRGYGLEPDPRFGGPPLASDRPCVVFRLSESSPRAPSPAYAAATITLQLAVAVAAADDDVSRSEVEELEQHLGRALSITAAERIRLGAHLSWLLAERPSTAGLKKRLEGLEPTQRQDIARFLVAVASADGRVSPAEITMLKRIYRLLDLDPTGVYSEVHAQATSTQPASREPVTVQGANVAPTSYAIPPPSAAPSAPFAALNMARVEEKLAQTAAVSALLSSIFIDEDDQIHAPAAPTSASGMAAIGLDVPHSAFVRAVATRLSWSRAELEALADSHGVLLDGALDAVNEAALMACGDALCEGDDPIEINPETLKELAL